MDTLPIFHFSLILLLVGLCLGSLWFYGYALYAAIDYWTHADPEVDAEFYPKLTVLKPLSGANAQRGANAQIDKALQSFCQQTYPHYQIVFAVQNAADPCVGIVQKLMQQFPDRDIDLVIGQRVTGLNARANLLANAAAVAKYGLWVISDPNIAVGPDYLQQIVQPFRYPGIGIVTCLYRSQPQGGLARLLALGSAAEFHPLVLVARRMQGVRFALGSTIAIRKDVLLELGGFAAIADKVAEDYQLGHLASKVGFRVMLSHYVVDRALSPASLGSHVQHQMNWSKNLWDAQPGGNWGKIITYGTVASVLLLGLLQGSWLGWSLLVATWTARMGLGYWVGVACLKDKMMHRTWLLLPLYDLLSFVIWCLDRIGRSFRWGKLQDVDQQALAYDLPCLEEPALEEI